MFPLNLNRSNEAQPRIQDIMDKLSNDDAHHRTALVKGLDRIEVVDLVEGVLEHTDEMFVRTLVLEAFTVEVIDRKGDVDDLGGGLELESSPSQVVLPGSADVDLLLAKFAFECFEFVIV